ncbi:MAG: carbohydrate binding domain-containing protein [Fimbriimonas sp.]|nr:carbohydrate binding domain-containing protein [Fimbriimonas sp.]
MKYLTTSIHLVTIAVIALAGQGMQAAMAQHQPRTWKQHVKSTSNELVISRFDRPADVARWNLATGLPGSKLAFDSHVDARGGPSKGSMKLVLPFNRDGEFDFNLDSFPDGIDIEAKGYASISLDVKVDPKSPAWGDFHAGWFELGIRTGKKGQTFLKQYGENLDTRKGWFHVAVPIIGNVSDARGFAIKFFASGLTRGNRIVWIDNLVLSKNRIAGAKPIQHETAAVAAFPAAKPGAEMLANGSFANGMSKWVLEESGDAKGTADVVADGPDGKQALRLNVLKVEDHSWHIQIYQTGMRIEKGRKYVMTFWAKSKRPGVITAECNQNHEPWEHETNAKLPVTTSWTLLHFDFSGPWNDSNVRISLTDLGTVPGQIYWFANCSLKPLGGPYSMRKPSLLPKDDVIESWECTTQGWHSCISDGDELGTALATSARFSSECTAVGKPSSNVFDTASWQNPSKAPRMCFWVKTDTCVKATPDEVYSDSLGTVRQ